MILVTNVSGEKFYLNPGLIEFVEMVPDTLITMTNDRKHYVQETAREVVAAIEAARASIMRRSMDPLDPYGIILTREEEPDDAEE
jgi:flagellar protein FlbD